jgi:D-alanine-D-alanine ligase-like ATP-grasp enzyme
MSHTVEEIKYNCEYAQSLVNSLKLYVDNVRTNLGLNHEYNIELPQKTKLSDFLDLAQSEGAFLFLGLHGGVGEDGTIQAMLETCGIEYNGSNSAVSRLCMNKYETGKVNVPGVESLRKILSRVVDNALVRVELDQSEVVKYLTYDILKVELQSDKLIIKPCSDGCSAGVVKITSQEDLDRYVKCIYNSELCNDGVEMPDDSHLKEYIIEKLIEVDTIVARDDHLVVDKKSGWVEMTVGVVEENGVYHSFNPSITIAGDDILSLEEKFQGGTGINLTPLPEEIISKKQLELIKKSVEEIGIAFSLKNYARVDIFFNTTTNKIILIEVNTLPALTPSTVIFHQALTEEKAIYPLEFLEKIISKKLIS